MTTLKERFCALRGCKADPVCLDKKNYTKWRSDFDGLGLFDDSIYMEGREIWFCREHAQDYLFPIIDRVTGYTTGKILRDMKDEGMM